MKPETQDSKLITSKDNSLLRQARSVRDGKAPELIFVEGLRLCEEAYTSGLDIEAVIYSDEIARKPRPAEVIAKLGGVCERMAVVSEALLATISYTKTPQGIVALAGRPDSGELPVDSENKEVPMLIVMHGLNNPVNVGAILRSAEAAGVSGVVTTANTADPFSPKALRGAMGSAFRLPIWHGPDYSRVIQWCGDNSIETVCADLEAQLSHTEFNWTAPSALIVGPESTGLSSDEVRMTGSMIRIPMQGAVESLNVAAAATIVLYEAARQRGLV